MIAVDIDERSVELLRNKYRGKFLVCLVFHGEHLHFCNLSTKIMLKT